MRLKLFPLMFLFFLVASTFAAGPAAPSEDGTLPKLTEITGHGMMGLDPYTDLQELSDDVGARVTGTPEDRKAIDWGLTKMKAIGLENVRAERYTLSPGWSRVSASAELVSPVRRRLQVDSLGWVGSTPAGGVEAEVIPVNVNRLDEEMRENNARWKGKVLLSLKRGEAPTEPQHGKFGEFLRAAHKAGAVAVIGGQGGSEAAGLRLTHTGALGYGEFFEIPVVSMAAEDSKQLERFLDAGKTVRLKLDVQNRVTPGAVETANVVGEIRGVEFPEQIIVVGGHLDSWDLAQGTTDDGVGVATTLGAARAIRAAGQRPRRTIRFVLFTGEEQGLLGSFAYVKQHEQEMANHIAAIVLDNGQGPITTLQLGGRKDVVPAVEKFTQAIAGLSALKVDDKPTFGTDTGPFTLAGIPAINLNQDSPEYKFTHHSAADTFDKVQQDILAKNTTVKALLAFWIADRPERLATPWTREQVARMLIEKKLDRQLKAYGIWPFGEAGTERKQ
ncbi:MAG TPA: M20/M25/M40 family metallo-hydrolase [Terriglobales bacterium]|nr:M20/M25/M40 family metallo-hydrolase [Terriglobales bacterium]